MADIIANGIRESKQKGRKETPMKCAIESEATDAVYHRNRKGGSYMKSTLLAVAVVLFSFTASAQQSFWSNSVIPGNPGNCLDGSTELGLRFQSSVSGQVTAVKFYKASQNTGTHIGHLWTGTGTLLATVTFSGETTSGWQVVNFSSPVPIAANTPYLVSYTSPNGFYAQDQHYFTTSSYVSGNLTAFESAVNGGGGTSGAGNGVYARPGGTFPSKASTYNSNAYVDVVFAPSGNHSIQLVWTSVNGASSYHIYRGTASGQENFLVTSTDTLSTTDSVVGGTYFYVVKSVTAGGTESGPSPELGPVVIAP